MEQALATDQQHGQRIKEEDGSFTGAYGPFTLKTALQPIFGKDRKDRAQLKGFEALLRVLRNDSSFPTADFLARIGSRERPALEAFCRSLHLKNASLETSARALLFLNINPAPYDDGTIIASHIQDLRKQVEASAFQPHRIVCEITEHRMQSRSLLLQLVDTLRESGFKIAVDDFGADASDASRVSLIRPDIVKLDSDWVKRLMDSKAGFSSLQESVSRFRHDGCLVVLEGLEAGWQVDLGWGAGADFIQGYGLARPELAPTNFSAQFAGAASAS